MKAVIEYLTKLNENNNREWFHANKKEYETVRGYFMDFVQQVIERLARVDPNLSDLKAADSVFRIYRDVRFSKDKTPYKPYFSAFMGKGGRKTTHPGYYMQFGPVESFIGAGVYAPDKEVLEAVRREILYTPEEYTGILDRCKEAGYTMMEDDKLKKGPKGFPADSPHLDLIKYKHYIFMKSLNGKEILASDLFPNIVTLFEGLVPFNLYLNSAIEFKGNI